MKIDSLSPPLVVGAVYRPPNSSLSVVESLYRFVESIVKKYKMVIMAGDFNLPNINWESCTTTRGSCDSSEHLVDICFDLELTQIVTMPTRTTDSSESVLDIVFVSPEIASSSFLCVIVDGMSDHSIVKVEFSCNLVKKVPLVPDRLVYDFEKASDVSMLDELHFALDEFECMYSSPHNNVEAMWLFFEELVFRCLTSFVPKRNLKPPKKENHGLGTVLYI